MHDVGEARQALEHAGARDDGAVLSLLAQRRDQGVGVGRVPGQRACVERDAIVRERAHDAIHEGALERRRRTRCFLVSRHGQGW